MTSTPIDSHQHLTDFDSTTGSSSFGNERRTEGGMMSSGSAGYGDSSMPSSSGMGHGNKTKESMTDKVIDGVAGYAKKQW